MRDADGRLLRTWKDGEAKLNAYLEDHAYLVEALLTLYEATLEVRWFDAARETADAMIDRFADPERGGFFTTSSDHQQLIARRKDVDDHPIPSGNSSAAYGLLRLATLTGEHRYAAAGRVGLQALRAGRRQPSAGGRPPAAGDRLPPLAGEGGGAGGTARSRRSGRARGRRARRSSVPTWCSRAGREGTRAPGAARRPDGGRRPLRRLRLRELRLPDAGQRDRGACRALDG